MNRSLLKQNAQLFEWAMRLLDPILVAAVGVIAYSAYLGSRSIPDQYAFAIAGYMQKHLVKAGITGWAQVNDLRGETDLRERIQYDLYYIEHWSLWFDLRIIAVTFLHIVRSRNAN